MCVTYTFCNYNNLAANFDSQHPTFQTPGIQYHPGKEAEQIQAKLTMTCYVYLLTMAAKIILLMVLVSCSYTESKCRRSVLSSEQHILNCSHMVLENIVLQDADGFNAVTVLDLSYVHLEALPEFVNPGSFPNVEHLNFSRNEIGGDKVLDLRIFTKIRNINLSFNKLNEIDMIIFPSSVTTLSFDHNEIRSVHLDSRYVTVKELYLQKNHITSFTHGRSDEMDKEISFELRKINLTGNKLQHINENTFFPFKKLQALYLSLNEFGDIEEGSFDRLPYLETIDLSQNGLKHIPKDFLSKHEYLKHLDLSGNKLQTLPSQLSIGLDWLDVSSNEITVLKEDLSSVLYPVRVFLIGKNPLTCTCDILWLKELFDVRKYLIQYLNMSDLSKFIPACDTPSKLRGIPWTDLKDEVFECAPIKNEDLKVTNEKRAGVLNEDEMLKTTQVTCNSIGVKWNVISTRKIELVQLSYYPFGRKKENVRTVKLSSRTTSYSIHSLEAHTPYVICLTVTTDKELIDCIEVITDQEPAASTMEMLLNILRLLKDRIDIVACVVGLSSLLYILYMLLCQD